jgi:hypothetical protein
MSQDLPWWGPLEAALSCILDMMPREQRVATEERLKLMAEAQEKRGDLTASYFCRALAGEEYPVPEPKPKFELIRGGAA